MKKRIYFLSILIIGMSCGSSQFRIEFDRTYKSVRTCDKNQMIKNITISEQGSNDIGFAFYLEEEEKGNSIIYLEKENVGYKTSEKSLFKFKPNKKYILSTTYLDSRAEIILFTNQYAEVDSVVNNYSCTK